MRKAWTTLSGVLCVALLVGGCGAEPHEAKENAMQAEPGPVAKATTPPATTRAAQAELVETYWKIVSADGQPVIVDSDAREAHLVLKAKDNTLAGSMGINRLTGSFELTGAGKIKLKPGGMTMMAGPEPLMKQEQMLVQKLTTVDGYRIEGQEMRFMAGGKEVMVLRAGGLMKDEGGRMKRGPVQ